MYALINIISLKELQRDIFAKKLVVCTMATLIVVLIGLCALIPAFITSGGINFLNNISDQMSAGTPNSTESSTGGGIESTARSNMHAVQLLTFVDEQMQSAQDTGALAYTRELFASRADIHVARTAIQAKKITVTGIADTRAALLTIQSAVRLDKMFTTSELPLSDLSGRDGLFPFTFTLTLAAPDKQVTPQNR